MRAILFAAGMLAIAGAAHAGDYLTLGDLVVLYQPDPTPYSPRDTSADLADQGKSFDIWCTIDRGGHMSNCRADATNMADQGFVQHALTGLREWVVGDHTRSGQATAGMPVRVTVRYQLRT